MGDCRLAAPGASSRLIVAQIFQFIDKVERFLRGEGVGVNAGEFFLERRLFRLRFRRGGEEGEVVGEFRERAGLFAGLEEGEDFLCSSNDGFR